MKLKRQEVFKSFILILGVVILILASKPSFADNEFDSDGRMIAKFGSPIIDGEIDEIWGSAPVYTPELVGGDIETKANFRVLWDDNAIYILAEVKDDTLSVQSGTPYMQDSVEIFIDENNDKSREFGVDDLQFRVNYQNVQTVDKGNINRFYTATRETNDGYIVEARIALRNKAVDGQIMGIELQINDAVGDDRAGTLNLFDATGMAWDNTALFGEIILLGKDEGAEPGLNPYDMINLLKDTQNIDLSLYKNSDTIQKEIDRQYQDLKAIIDNLEYTDEAANEKWFEAVPDEYRVGNNDQGRIERLEYQAVKKDGGIESKYMNLYLPHNYDKNNKYNILYLMHGGGEDEDTLFGGPGEDTQLKRIIDNMIVAGDIEPLIVVTPTFYGGSNSPEAFPKELLDEIIPLVESKYSTYAESTDKEGIKDSRDHRAFGGFSMGSITTWHVYINCLDYIKYYLPLCGETRVGELSGNTNPVETAEFLADVAKEAGYTAEDFYLFCANGSEDIAYPNMKPQMDAMKELDTFIYSSDIDKGNFYFLVAEDGTHAWHWVNQYIYNILPDLFVN